MSNINPEIADLFSRARILQQNLLGNITGSDLKDPLNNEEVWRDDDPTFLLDQGEVEAVFDKRSIRFNFGSGCPGLYSGVYPIIEGVDRSTGEYGSTRLEIDSEGKPKFRIYPAIGAAAVQNF